MVGEHVYIYAMVGISVKSGNQRSDKRRSGKRCSANLKLIRILRQIIKRRIFLDSDLDLNYSPKFGFICKLDILVSGIQNFKWLEHSKMGSVFSIICRSSGNNS